MASLLLGGIGGFMFGPIGFLAGSLLGNLLFPTKQEGPRLSNLKLQGSSYGQMIPIAYGTIRLAGQVVWQTDLTEHKHSSGGKGGPQVTTYTYTASFAVKICKGPIAGVLTIWANGEVIWDTTGNFPTVDNTQIPVTIYNGVEGALPDPTMEADLGVGNVPAFQDDAVAVFTDWDLGYYGNTLPQLSFLVFASGGPIPWRVSSFVPAIPVTAPHPKVVHAATYDTTTGALTEGGFYGKPLLAWYSEYSYLTDGTPSGTNIDTAVELIDGIAPDIQVSGFGGVDAGPYACLHVNEFDGDHHGWFYKNVLVRDLGHVYPPPVYGEVAQVGNYLYAINLPSYPVNPVTLSRWPISGTVPASMPDIAINLSALSAASFNQSDVRLVPGDNGLLYVALDSRGGGSTNLLLFEFNQNLTVSRSWQDGQIPSGIVNFSWRFVVYHGMLCAVDAGLSLLGHFNLWTIENPGTTWPVVGQIPVTASNAARANITRFHNGLVLTADGVISLDPPQEPVTLASIVSDLSVRVGLSTGDIDVTQLTQLVDGYLVTTRADARTDLDPLRAAYYFDAVEQNGKAVFVNRGSQPILTIPDNDLAAQAPNTTPPPIVEIVRVQEIDLPVSVNVTYINVNAAYQNGTQQAIRQTVLAQAVSDVQLAIAMSDQKGRQVANINLYEAWTERTSFTFNTSRKYLYLEPTDVVSVHGYTMRIEKKTSTVAGLVTFEAKQSNPAIYIIALSANATSGGQQPVSGTAQPTRFIPLDIALVQDTDLPYAFYAAMAGTVDDTWRGANLYVSRDTGATYTQDANAAVATVMGTVQGVLGNWGGGNMFDEINSVSVLIGPGGGALAGASELAVLNGANTALVGNELLQFKNAVLTAPSTYLLSGFLRGRRGTEWAISTHSPIDQFILMTPTDAALLPSDFNQPLLYKAATFQQPLAAVSTLTFADTFQTLRCYSPTAIGGGINGAGDVLIHWVRRTRVGGQWADLADVPLSEAVESYVLQVWDATFTICARVVAGLTSPTFIYTAAMQTTDFGATQQHIYVTIGQIGTFGLGRQAPATLPGAGGSDSTPLVPVMPYNFAPPAPPPPGGCSGNVTTGHLNWASPVRIFSPVGFGPGDVWLVDFTPTGSGQHARINAGEWAATPTNRHGQLSDAPCGQPVQPGGTSYGSSIIFYFAWGSAVAPYPGIPVLAAGTKYYISITNDSIVSQMFMDLYVIP